MNSKTEILEELRRSRAAIARDTASVARELDVASKIRRSIVARPLAWLGGAAVIGYMFAGPKSRKASKVPSSKNGPKSEKAEPAKTGWRRFFSILLNMARILFPLFRPALSAYAAQRLGEMSSRFSR